MDGYDAAVTEHKDARESAALLRSAMKERASDEAKLSRLRVIDMMPVLFAIAALAKHDDEAAHALEDEMREHILAAISLGRCSAHGAAELAEMALETSKIKFARHSG